MADTGILFLNPVSADLSLTRLLEGNTNLETGTMIEDAATRIKSGRRVVQVKVDFIGGCWDMDQEHGRVAGSEMEPFIDGNISEGAKLEESTKG